MYDASQLETLCSMLFEGDVLAARQFAVAHFPLEVSRPVHSLPVPDFRPRVDTVEVREPRRQTPASQTSLFVRDGFIDRYTGERVVYPAALRLISALIPIEFPFHKNWKPGVGHGAYWSFSATCDHVVPISQIGGYDQIDNWVTCSMLTNERKSHSSIEDLGWSLKPPGVISEWDGLLGWFLSYIERYPSSFVSVQGKVEPIGLLRGIKEWIGPAKASAGSM